jgi:hypothetical protein
MAKTTAILLTRESEKVAWSMKFSESHHEAYTEYKRLYVDGKVDVELWTSSQGRIAKRHQSAPKVNMEAAKPIDEQAGTNDFKSAAKKKETRAELKARGEAAEKQRQQDLAAQRVARKERTARAELAGQSVAELLKDVAALNAESARKEKLTVTEKNQKAEIIDAILAAHGIIIAKPADPESADSENVDDLTNQ